MIHKWRAVVSVTTQRSEKQQDPELNFKTEIIQELKWKTTASEQQIKLCKYKKLLK